MVALANFFIVPENADKHKNFAEMLINPIAERKAHYEKHENTTQHLKTVSVDRGTQKASKNEKNILSTGYKPRF
jgi:hypothetical protein